MMPITDDELLCFAWKDGLSEARHAEIDALLLTDVLLRARFSALSRDLEVLRSQPDVERDGRGTVHALPPARARRPAALVLGALAATLIAGLLVGWLVSRPKAPEAEDRALTAYRRGLAQHLEALQEQLERLPSDDAAARTAGLDEVILQNELLRSIARRAGDEQSARVLTGVRLQLEALSEPATDGAPAGERLQQVLFELGVMQTRLQGRPSKVRAAL